MFPKALETMGGTMVKFGDVVRLCKERSQDPKADGFERYIGLEHLERGDLKIRSWGNVADGTTFTNVFRPGQVLFGKRRAYQRKVAVADFCGVCSGDIYVFKPKGDHLLSEFLPFICQSDPFYDYVISMSQGGLSPRVNWKALATFTFNLPALKTQQRAIQELQSIESCLDSNNAVADRLLAIMPSLRERCFTIGPPRRFIAGTIESGASQFSATGQSYAGISSRRTMPRRESAGYPTSVEPGKPRLPPLPKGWERIGLSELLQRVQRPADVDDDTTYQLIVAKRFRAGIAAREQLFGREILTKTQFYVRIGDFVISRRQIIHGACGFVTEEFDGALVSNEYDVLRPTELIEAGFLNHLTHTVYFQQACFHASVGVALEKMIFSLDDWLTFEINLPPIEEQRRIVRCLDQVDNAIRSVDEQFQKLVAVKQGFLHSEIGGFHA